MSEAGVSLKAASESVRISRRVKKRLQEYSRRHNRSIRQVLDEAVGDYVQKRFEKRVR